MVSIQRDRRQLGDVDGLLHGIAEEFKFIRRVGIDRSFLRVAALAKRIPAVSSLLQHATFCYGTTVLTSVGKLFSRATLPRVGGKVVVGGLSLDSIVGVPPVRHQTPVSFGCHWYAGRLVLNLNYDWRRVERVQAQALMAEYCGRVSGQIPERDRSSGDSVRGNYAECGK